MEDCKALLQKGEFARVEALTRQAKDGRGLLYRLSALLGLCRYEEALALVTSNRQALWQENPLRTLQANFELRFALGQFDEAYADLDYFQQLPYVRQEVEEALRALPQAIRAAERAARPGPEYQDEEIAAIFAGRGNDMELLHLLHRLQQEGADRYLTQIREVATSLSRPSDLRTFALLLLLSCGDEQALRFEKNGVARTLIPAKLHPPFSDKDYATLANRLSGHKDASLGNLALSLVNQVVLALFPEPLASLGPSELLEDASLALARRYLRLSSPPATKAMEEAMGKIERLLRENPPLGE